MFETFYGNRKKKMRRLEELSMDNDKSIDDDDSVNLSKNKVFKLTKRK